MAEAVSERRRTPLYALFAAMGVSMTGNTVSELAIPWYVLTTTGSPARAGMVAFMSSLAKISSAFFGGAVVDKLGFRKAGVGADLASCVAVASIPLLSTTVGLPFWVLLGLVFLGAVLDTSGDTARQALVVELAEDAGMPLGRANSLGDLATYAPYLLGPVLGGMLIAWLGVTQALWVDAASFALSAAILLLVVPSRIRTKPTIASKQKRGYWASTTEGLTFLHRERTLLWVVGLASVVALIAGPVPSVLLPVYVRETLGSALHLGLIVSAFGFGFAVGIGLYGALAERVPKRVVLAVGIGAFAALSLVFVTTPPLWVILPATLLAGVLYGPLEPLTQTVAGERTPEELRGRVFGTLSAIAGAGAPAGMLIAGFGLEALGVRPFFGVIGALLCAMAVLVFAPPALRALDSGERSMPECTPESPAVIGRPDASPGSTPR